MPPTSSATIPAAAAVEALPGLVRPSGSLGPVDEVGGFLRRVRGVDCFRWDPWRASGDDEGRLVGNAGDLLGPLVVELLLERLGPVATAPPAPGRRVLSVGSVLHFARPGDVVWGSGVNGKVHAAGGHQPDPHRAPDVRATRGPLTAAFLTAHGIPTPAVYGDPALLLPDLLPELRSWSRVKRTDVLVVPNLNDVGTLDTAGYPVLSTTEPVRTVLRTIAQSRFVVGSSLHAVIVADALGIPARLVASPTEGPVKYRDYLAGTGRPRTRIASDVAEAVALGGHEPAAVDADALRATFPGDAWGLGPRATQVRGAAIVDATFSPRVLDEIDDVVTGRLDTARATRVLLDDLLPAAVEAARTGDATAAELVAQAAQYHELVVPSLAPGPTDDATAELLDLVLARDVTRLGLAARLHAVEPCAEGRATRPARTGQVLSLTLQSDRARGGVSRLGLVLQAVGGPGRVVLPVPASALHARQWLVDVDVVAPAALLADAARWEVWLEVTSSDDRVRRVPVARPGSRGLSEAAVVTGGEAPVWIIDGDAARVTTA